MNLKITEETKGWRADDHTLQSPERGRPRPQQRPITKEFRKTLPRLVSRSLLHPQSDALRRRLGTFSVTVLALLMLLSVGRAAAPDTMAKLDEALTQVAAFQYGKDAGPLNVVEGIVIEAAKNPDERAAVEQRLAQTLAGTATRDGKEFICRQLFTIGTARSIPELEALLIDPELSHIARYALGRNEDPEASAALRRALGKTTGKIRVGILNTLGERRYEAALPDFEKLMNSGDPATAIAAATALGSIGNVAAVKLLEAARPQASEQLGPRIDDALLRCADRFLASGQQPEATIIYLRYSATSQPAHLQIAALRGLVAAGGGEAQRRLVEAIKSPEAIVRSCAIGFVRSVTGSDSTRTFAELLPSLPPDAQQLLLHSLGDRGDRAATPAVIAAAKSNNDGVRIAACEALGSLGGADTVEFLAHTAATASAGERQAARESLARLTGADINPSLRRLLNGVDPKMQVELIRALAARRATDAIADLLNTARAANEPVRREAFSALGALAGETDFAALVTLAVKPKDANDRPSIEQAIESVFRRNADPQKQAEPLLTVLPSAPADAKPVLLQLLGRAATAKALEAVRAALKDENPTVQDAALRSLADWPNAQPAADLLAVAGSAAAGPTAKALALRGYVRMAGQTDDPAQMYAQALALAPQADDKKRVLGGLGTASSVAALTLVEQYLNDPQLRAEAATAAVQIASRLPATDAARAKAALKNVLAAGGDTRLRRQAQEVLNQLEQFDGYILEWSGAGPFQVKGKDSHALFGLVFPPEEPEAQGVKWSKLTRGIGAWDINLGEAVANAEDCAAYMRTRVWSPVAQDARLELGSDDGIKAWLNDKLVHANDAERGLAPRQDLVPVKLNQGWNDLRLKVVNRSAGWSFCCRLRQSDGSSLEGLKVQIP
jgi:HEAT repeat protein